MKIDLLSANMEIPMILKQSRNDGCFSVLGGGRQCWYTKTALMNTLLYLQPRFCLEIGTGRYAGTAKIFAWYFREHCPDGALVTCDIWKSSIGSAQVRSIMVYPHTVTEVLKQDCGLRCLRDWERVELSVARNCDLLEQELATVGAEKFDFALVDGDHSATGLLKDLEIVRRMTKWPYVALLDDTYAAGHESGQLYHDRLIHEYEHYEYEKDWGFFVGASLIWSKDE